MNKKLVSLICAAGILMGTTAVAAEEPVMAYKPLIKVNFDDFKGVDESTGSYSGETGSLYIEGKPTAPIKSAKAPQGKADGTSLTQNGADDMALHMILGDKGNSPYFNANIPAGGFSGKLKMSFNYCVPACESGNYGPLSVDVRVDNSYLNNLLSVRGNKAYRLFPDGNNNNPQQYGTIVTGRWYHVEYCFDTETAKYDVYIDGKLQGEGGFDFNAALAYKMLRFYAVNNSSNGVNLKNTSVYIDDLFLGSECEAPVPEYVCALNADAEQYSQQEDIPEDMTALCVSFPTDMNAASFEGNVSLTRSGGKAVAFEGSYDEQSKIYTAVLKERAMPCTGYELTFGSDILTADKIPLTIDRTFNVSTVNVPFAVTDSGFYAADGEQLLQISADDESVSARVNMIATDMLTEAKDVTMLVFCYQNGEMQNVLIKQTQITPPQGTQEFEAELEIPLGDMEIDENTMFEISVWDSYLNMLPLYKAAQISVMAE